MPPRKNGVAYYHEILSLAGADQPQADAALLLDLARHYLRLRAPDALAYGRVHFDPQFRKNPHVHLAISGNLCGQAKKLRLSKAEFRAIREELERYQQERYPQLKHSLVGADREPHHPAGRGEQELKRRQGGGLPARKQQLGAQYQEARLQAVSERDFRFRLACQGMELYFRGGRLAGVTSDGKKYRLTTLGLADTYAADCAAWRQLPDRLRVLDEVALTQTRTRIREHGFADALLNVIGEAGRAALPAHLKERLAALDRCRLGVFRRDGLVPG